MKVRLVLNCAALLGCALSMSLAPSAQSQDRQEHAQNSPQQAHNNFQQGQQAQQQARSNFQQGQQAQQQARNNFQQGQQAQQQARSNFQQGQQAQQQARNNFQQGQQAQQQARNTQLEQQRNANLQNQRLEQATQKQSRNNQLEQQRVINLQEKRVELPAQNQARNDQLEQQRNANLQNQRLEQATQKQSRNNQLEQQRVINLQEKRVELPAQNHSRNDQVEQQSVNNLQEKRVEHLKNPIRTPNFDKTTRRPSALPPLGLHNVPLQKAFPMPDFTRATSNQREHARNAEQNLRAHLIAVPMNQAPQNYAHIRNTQLSTYYNNYSVFVNNQQYSINRQNTHYYPVQPSYYPEWYQPNNNWVFSNGFTLGNAINIGLEWLSFGWQPYYGAAPVGFICNRDYMPTPWMYDAMTNQWRQPGLYTYMNEGPNSEYTGPITVEVIEQVRDRRGRIINVPYLYNAFYYPEFGRWGYENRQGYFIWLNV